MGVKDFSLEHKMASLTFLLESRTHCVMIFEQVPWDVICITLKSTLYLLKWAIKFMIYCFSVCKLFCTFLSKFGIGA